MTTHVPDRPETVIATRVPNGDAKQLQALARAEDRTLSAELRRMVREYLRGQAQ